MLRFFWASSSPRFEAGLDNEIWVFSVFALREAARYILGMSKISAEEFELLAFFGNDPERLDAGVPWVYNTLTYRASSGNITVVLKISPSYKTTEMHFFVGNQVVFKFSGTVSDLHYLETEKDEQFLKIQLPQNIELALSIKPHIYISQTCAE